MTPEQIDTERRPAVRDTPTEAGVDADGVRRRLHARSARIERREVEEALSKLDARGEFTAEQRRILRRLGATLARRLTPAPEAALEGDGRDDEESVRTLARLFDVVHEDRPDIAHEKP
jgi:hypothetical protein